MNERVKGRSRTGTAARIVALASGILAGGGWANAQTCPVPQISFGTEFQRSKYLRTTSMPVAPAQQLATRARGYLASIASSAENSAVASASPGTSWIGLSIEHRTPPNPPILRWDSGQSVTFVNWGTPQEPNNFGGNETRVAINEHRTGGWNDLPATRSYPAVVEFPMGDGVRITRPTQNAVSRSEWVGLEGTSGPGGRVTLEVLDGQMNVLDSRVVDVDGEGNWEAVLRPGPCGRAIRARATVASNITQDIVFVRATSTARADPVDPGLLLTGDVLSSFTSGNVQTELYGAVWSHVAVYVGPDADGTPMISESVVRTGALSALGESALGFSHTVPVESSDIWADPTRAGIFRLPGLTRAQRSSVASTARSLGAGRPYWTGGDFGLYVDMQMMWIPIVGAPDPLLRRVFDAHAARAAANTASRSKLICSTLVRAAYLDSIGVDLHTRSGAPVGGWFTWMFPSFGRYLVQNDLFVVPDTVLPSLQEVR